MGDEIIRIAYMGTPDFAVPALVALHASRHEIVFAVTQPDRPRGRGHKLTPSPVKQRAGKLGIKVLQPETLKGGAGFEDSLNEARPDLIVVCAYGKILPKGSLDFPRLGCVNIHASLLPEYRGAAPVHRAVEAGERETGVTLMYMSEGLDEGDMIARRSLLIEGMNTGEATDALAVIGAELLMDELPAIIGGTARREPQNGALATYAPPVEKAEGHVDFSVSPDAVLRKILAMTPFPGAYAYLGGEKIKLIEAVKCTETPEVSEAQEAPDGAAVSGGIAGTDGGVIKVRTGDGLIGITKLQAPGGKPMKVSDYLRGRRPGIGAKFE
jgi:methionyl-tRNA formyltransferase